MNEYSPRRSNSQVSRSKSILDRTKDKFKWRQRHDRYNTLQDVDEANEQDIVGVDISSLGGPLELTDFQLNSHPSKVPNHRREISEGQLSIGAASSSSVDEIAPLKSPMLGHGLGDGMRVGASFRVNPAASKLQRATSQNPQQITTGTDLARARTIRKIGQREAQQLGTIVAIDDATPGVDLSTYEGMKRANTEQSFDTIQTTFDANKQSYFYPGDPQQPDWKPFSMRKPYIIMLILISLVLAGVQEWLCQKSMRLAKQHRGLINFDRVADVSLLDFFVWKYMPTLIFVVYGVLWQIMDYETKRLEPYYQLSQPTGSTAVESLNIDYLTMWSNLAPFKAIQYRQWAVLCSALGNLLASSAAASLQNPSIVFGKNDPKLRKNAPNYYVRVSPVWSRFLTATLVLVAALGGVLFFQLRRKSGLLSDPKGIAGIAAMATKSHILNDFSGMDEANHREIHKKLQHRRYILHKSSIWQGEYIKVNTDNDTQRIVGNPHPILLRLKAGIPFIGFLISFLIFIPLISLTPANIIPNNAPWLPVLIATIIKQLWTTFEFDVRMMEPFYILSKGHAPPQTTLTLDYTGTPYAYITIQSLFNKHWLLALVSFGSILVDILTVTVSSFSVNGRNLLRNPNKHESPDSLSSGDQTFKSYWVSVALSMAISIFLILCASLVYWRRRHPFLPRQPSTIASVLAFIHQSKMLYDFVDTETMNNKQMEERLKALGKKYGLGWFKGRDGKPHCGIDEEELLSRYVHGKSYLLAIGPWVDLDAY
jgi:hypothetical protein